MIEERDLLERCKALAPIAPYCCQTASIPTSRALLPILLNAFMDTLENLIENFSEPWRAVLQANPLGGFVELFCRRI
jgi:hypothetical protein